MDGNELKAALSRLGLSQRAFAKLLTAYSNDTTVTATTVNRWCQDEHPIPGAVALAVDLLERNPSPLTDIMAKTKE